MENNLGNGAIGTIFEKDGKKYKIVNDMDRLVEGCSKCALLNICCENMQCLSTEREDGKSVHYEEVKTK